MLVDFLKKGKEMTGKSIFFIAIVALLLAGCGQSSMDSARIRRNIDFDWKFSKGDVANAQNPDLDDQVWSTVNLPHDWMIEGPVLEDNPSGIAGGFFPGGIGWYRKSLKLSPEQKGKKVYINFDGIFRNSDVWVNGRHVGHRTYGYISHYYDITPYVNCDAENLIAVRVDCSAQPIDRWYSGCGIYRHVWLTIADPLHIPVWGTYITTPEIDDAKALVKLQTKIKNEYAGEQTCRLVTRIISPSGKMIDELSTEKIIDGDSLEVIEQQSSVSKPELWDIESPLLYTAVSFVYTNDKLVDTYVTTFGVRNVEFRPDSGFLLNGKKVILKGLCLHHDGGSIGAAVPDQVWQRRLKILKAMGVNSVRLAHNPHAPEILDMCDRLGILVFDELYDKWVWPWQEDGKKPAKWSQSLIDEYKRQFEASWEKDLTDFIDRDKNHPCVFIWSVGNETMEQLRDPNDAIRQLKRYIAKCHELDPSRAATCALHPHGKNRSDMIHYVDVVSYNYRTKDMTEWHEQFPDYVWIGSETKAYRKEMPADWSKIDWSENSWFHLGDCVAGQYIWAGIDYLGESRAYPDKGIRSGIIFSNGFQKGYSYFAQSVYSEKPMVHIVALDDVLFKKITTEESWAKSWYGPPVSDHWTFPEREGRNIEVFVHTNCESVELELNGKSLGTKELADFPDRVIRWDIPYEKGTIVAIGKDNGKAVCKHKLTTAGEPAKVVLSADRTNLNANGKDVANIEVFVTDKNGVRVPRATNLIHFDVTGAGKILGIDNGQMSDLSRPADPDRNCMDGRLLLMVQADREAGNVIVKAESTGLSSKPLKLKVR
jgi:beta-galactosidase